VVTPYKNPGGGEINNPDRPTEVTWYPPGRKDGDDKNDPGKLDFPEDDPDGRNKLKGRTKPRHRPDKINDPTTRNMPKLNTMTSSETEYYTDPEPPKKKPYKKKYIQIFHEEPKKLKQ
jgi:hypothetical protein